MVGGRRLVFELTRGYRHARFSAMPGQLAGNVHREPVSGRVLGAATLLAALLSLVASPVAVTLHGAFGGHVRCVEHGELVDLAPGDRAGARDGSRPRHAGWSAAPSQDGRGGHEHCLVAQGGLSATWSTAGGHGVPLAVLEVLPAAAPREAPGAGRPVYTYAPKQSPTSA